MICKTIHLSVTVFVHEAIYHFIIITESFLKEFSYMNTCGSYFHQAFSVFS